MNSLFLRVYRHPAHHPFVEAALGGFDNWDSEHFITIAEYGYQRYEQTLAFFPLFPSLLWFLSQSVFQPLLLFLSLRSVLLISGFVFNLTVFPFAALCLYLLTFHVSKDRRFSLLAAALFCINPASVFMSAVYTECLFALFTFSGLLMLERDRPWTAAVLFMFAAAVRSNGIVLCGYIGYRCLCNVFRIFSTCSLGSLPTSIKESFLCVFPAGLQCILVSLPFALFQYYGYYLYCGRYFPPKWCDSSIPMSYSSVQERYWGNGFLRYYKVDRIPYFIQATPMIILSSCCIVRYFLGRYKVKVEEDKEQRSSFHLQ